MRFRDCFDGIAGLVGEHAAVGVHAQAHDLSAVYIETEVALIAVADVVHDPLIALKMTFFHRQEVELVVLAGAQLLPGIGVGGVRALVEIHGKACACEEELIGSRLDEQTASARLEVLAVFGDAQVDAGDLLFQKTSPAILPEILSAPQFFLS